MTSPQITSFGTHSPFERYEHSAIIQEVADAYDDWRGQYGAPRTKSATLQMVEDVISPILDRLSSWEAHQKAATSTIDDIKNLIAQMEIMR